jgi:hypothetical protein
MHIESFEIAERFCGPPRSGNGGYVCGRIAGHLQGTVAVRLKAPPPLKTELRLESTDREARLFHGAALIGEAKQSTLELNPPPAPSYADAVHASQGFLGLTAHPFPGCFVCGTGRKPTDGLCLFPGPVNQGPLIASPWVPAVSLADESGAIRSEFLWSALDCPGAFAVMPSLPDGITVVLGELCASIICPLTFGERCVVSGWPINVDGRKHLAGSAVYGADGRLVAMARAVWIEVPVSVWR